VSFVIRDARAGELDEVAAVMLDAYREHVPTPASPTWEEYWAEIGDVRSRLGSSELIVATQAGRIVGAVTFYPDGAADGFPEGWTAIRLLAVHPSARGRGIGRALTLACLERARQRDAPTVGLHTTARMSVARKLYEAMGFRRIPEADVPLRSDLCLFAYRLDL
jgi:ribosomal protein S18 acetylase RimI-like enzyme